MTAGNVQVRPAAAGDAAAIRDIYAPVVRDTTASFEAQPPDAAEIRRRILACTPLRLPWLVAENERGIAGYAYAAPFRTRHAYRWSVETSVYLAPAAQGRGTGQNLYRRLLADLQELGYVRAFAGIALPNEASTGLHRALGFTPIGVFPCAGYKHGRWVDVAWWTLALRAAPAVPAEPRAWQPCEPG